jgi:CBS domain-containing protein
MTRTVVTVKRHMTMRELAELFEKHDFNAFPVVENGKTLGIVSKFDFLRAFAFTSNQIVPHYELMNRAVADVPPGKISQGQAHAQALKLNR